MDVVFDGAFGGVEDEEVVVREGVVVTSSSIEMLTNSCLGGIMVSLIFLEGLEEEALVEFMVELFKEDDEKKSHVLYDRVMNSLVAQLEQKPKRDRDTGRGRHSTSSSTFNQPSSSHLNDVDDGNNEGTLHARTPSPIRYVNRFTNEVPQVFQNPPDIDPNLEPFYTRQTKIINRQV
nr:hypothetical protein [Tanacetum cinerariifolium]